MSDRKKEEARVHLSDLSASGNSVEVVASPSRCPTPTKQYLLWMQFLFLNPSDKLCSSLSKDFGDFLP